MRINMRYIEAAMEATQLLTKIEKAAADKVYQYDEGERAQTIDSADAALEALEYMRGRIHVIRDRMISTDVTAYE
jgi:hypothetical protein|tara:strand:+ start:130 stop:354 length:225 start_codon:yes stop_codon:yes gene_type:complete